MKMDAGDVHARLHALIARRPALLIHGWKEAVEEFRLDFFGPNHRDLSFPVKLHMVVSCEPLHEEIFWTDDGGSFAINREGYRRRIMFVFFDQQTLRSFQNLVKSYKFKTERSTGRFPDEVAQNFLVYSHPSFVRGNRGLSRWICAPESPRNSKGGATKAAVNESSSLRRSEGGRGNDKEIEEGDVAMMLIEMSFIVDSERASSESQQDRLLRELDIST